MQNFYKKGMSVVEILITIAILTIIFLITIPQFSKMRENQVLKNAVGDITSSMNNAQAQSLASVDSSEYGVRFQSDRIIIFKGKIYDVNSAENKTVNIISPASISNVTLAGVSSTEGDLYFERLSGVPSKIGTITISTSSLSKIITISSTGSFSLN